MATRWATVVEQAVTATWVAHGPDHLLRWCTRAQRGLCAPTVDVILPAARAIAPPVTLARLTLSLRLGAASPDCDPMEEPSALTVLK